MGAGFGIRRTHGDIRTRPSPPRRTDGWWGGPGIRRSDLSTARPRGGPDPFPVGSVVPGPLLRAPGARQRAREAEIQEQRRTGKIRSSDLSRPVSLRTR
eukprot:1176425-Pyramimonas_sp.AAC.1